MPKLTLRLRMPRGYGLRMRVAAWIVGIAGMIGNMDMQVEVGLSDSLHGH